MHSEDAVKAYKAVGIMSVYEELDPYNDRLSAFMLAVMSCETSVSSYNRGICH